MAEPPPIGVDDPRVRAALAAWRERVAAGEALEFEAFLAGQPAALHPALRRLRETTGRPADETPGTAGAGRSCSESARADAGEEDEDDEPRPGPAELAAEEALKVFLALEHGDQAPGFEAFRDEQPAELRPLLESKYAAVQRFRREVPSLDWADLARLAHEPDPGLATASFSDERGDRSVDPQDILDRVVYTRQARGRYVDDGQVGLGGEGEIRRVWDRLLRRVLAKKVMHDRAEGAEGRAADRLRRFHEEALITSELDHPAILPIHDLGLDGDGRVYYTMKYVRGRKDLRRVLEERGRAGSSWTLNRIVAVLQRVAEAVAYAHSKGILHRDIKPANILVGAYGQAYLADWGLARRLDDPEPAGATVERRPFRELPGGEDLPEDTWLLTRDGQTIGTPPYMSPEQARGDPALDERSDVYALGAVLYQVLTGCVPYVETGARPEPLVVLLQVIRGRLTPVAELAPDAPPGLIAICERAMAREPADRYASAAELAAALEDYLADLSADREEARRQARRAETINAFLVRMLVSGDPSQALGQEVTVRQVLDQAAAQLGRGLDEAPYETAILRRTIGTLYRELGLYDRAEPPLERAARELAGLLGPDHVESLQAALERAQLARLQGRLDEAERRFSDLLEAQEQTLGAGHPDTLSTLLSLAEVLRVARGRLDEVEALMRRALAGRREVLGRHAKQTLTTQNRLANVLIDRGGEARLAEAEGLLGEAAELLARHHTDRDPASLTARHDLGRVQLQRGDLAGAERSWSRVLPLQRLVLGDEHPHTLTTQANLGWVLGLQGRLDEGEALLREAVVAQRRVLGDDNPTTRVFRHNLALLTRDRGDLVGARRLLEELVADWRDDGGLPNWHLARARSNLGRVLARLGDVAGARRELQAALAIYAQVLEPGHRFAVEAAAALAALDDGDDRRAGG